MNIQKDLWLSNILKKDSFLIKKKPLDVKPKKNAFYYYKSKKKLNNTKKYNLILISTILKLNKRKKKKEKCYKINKNKVLEIKNIRGKKFFFQQLVYNNFKYSRFFIDKNFFKKESNLVYYNWVADAIKSKRKKVYCILNKSNIISCIILKIKLNTMSIDLTLTNKKFQRKGYAYQIMKFIIEKFYNRNFVVGTEQQNKAANKFYRKFGFKKIKSCYVYHLHT